MQALQQQFSNRDELIAYVKDLAPWAAGEHSYLQGGRTKAERKLAAIDPITYARYP